MKKLLILNVISLVNLQAGNELTLKTVTPKFRIPSVLRGIGFRPVAYESFVEIGAYTGLAAMSYWLGNKIYNANIEVKKAEKLDSQNAMNTTYNAFNANNNIAFTGKLPVQARAATKNSITYPVLAALKGGMQGIVAAGAVSCFTDQFATNCVSQFVDRYRQNCFFALGVGIGIHMFYNYTHQEKIQNRISPVTVNNAAPSNNRRTINLLEIPTQQEEDNDVHVSADPDQECQEGASSDRIYGRNTENHSCTTEIEFFPVNAQNLVTSSDDTTIPKNTIHEAHLSLQTAETWLGSNN